MQFLHILIHTVVTTTDKHQLQSKNVLHSLVLDDTLKDICTHNSTNQMQDHNFDNYVNISASAAYPTNANTSKTVCLYILNPTDCDYYTLYSSLAILCMKPLHK